MKYAMSNIAWAYEERLDAYKLLSDNGFTGLEIAPGLLFPNAEKVTSPTAELLSAAQSEISGFGLHLVSMQSLHFGVSGASLFGDTSERAAFFQAIENCLELAERLELRNLVVGSPKARVIPDEMQAEDAKKRAIEWFQDFAEKTVPSGQILGIEPNPAAYGTNFLTHMTQAIDFVDACAHPKIGLNFDIGSLKMNDQFDQIGSYVNSASQFISHVHISEPFLEPVTEDSKISQALKSFDTLAYDHFFSVEMKRSGDNALQDIEAALKAVANS